MRHVHYFLQHRYIHQDLEYDVVQQAVPQHEIAVERIPYILNGFKVNLKEYLQAYCQLEYIGISYSKHIIFSIVKHHKNIPLLKFWFKLRGLAEIC